MKYLIVTQTYPPRTGGMQNVMNAISNKLASLNETHVFPDHYFRSKDSSSKIFIHNNFAPKFIRPLVKKKLLFWLMGKSFFQSKRRENELKIILKM